MWNELIITVKSSDCEFASNILTVLNHDGMFIEDYSDLMDNEAVKQTNLVEKDLLDKIQNDPILHLYISPASNLTEVSQTAQALLQQNGIQFSMEIHEIPDKNWNEEWMKYYKPVHITDHLTIVPQWIEYQPKENEKIVLLDPGAAFGTGTHETTKLCLSVLDSIICKDDTILDIGTGSGILAITALLLGAKSADAIDIDPLSVKAAKENAKLNHMDEYLTVKLGNLLDQVKGQYDVITANIVADVIISLLADIKPFMKPNGVLILSGIIREREADVSTALTQYNYSIVEKHQDGEWFAFVVKK